jgi:2-polyprenyl-3-methyl-5-hydroxy-6-metoxy-1,4-benzoquinol methylase
MSFFPRDLAAPAAAGPLIVWEEPDCLLCGCRNWSSLVEAADSTAGGTGWWFAVVQCQECGLCFTNPRPNIDTISQFYPPVYRPHRTSSLRRPRWRIPGLPARTRAPKEQRVVSWRHPGRLLDFGCGGGAFLAHMHQQGWQVTGLDVSTTAIQRIRAELGLRSIVGTLPHPELRPASFDVITMWHSLEHVHFPLQVLREARRLLVPGGKLFVAVPNIDSFPFRWFGSAWYGLDLPRHLTHFTPWTLHLILEKAGFRVGPIRMVRHSDWLRSSAKRACQTARPSYWHRYLTAKPFSRLAAWYCHLSRQSDCIMVRAER